MLGLQDSQFAVQITPHVIHFLMALAVCFRVVAYFPVSSLLIICIIWRIVPLAVTARHFHILNLLVGQASPGWVQGVGLSVPRHRAGLLRVLVFGGLGLGEVEGYGLICPAIFVFVGFRG